MITDRKLTDSLYRRFRRPAATLDERCLYLLADMIVDQRGMELDNDRLIFHTVSPSSPFREIPLKNINGVADLGAMLAIVLHSSIIFINKESLATDVHIKQPTLADKFRAAFHRR